MYATDISEFKTKLLLRGLKEYGINRELSCIANHPNTHIFEIPSKLHT
jgi:hypothetical protein